jgi:hypothetical protein
MLGPDVIDVSADLADAYSEIVSVDRYASAGMNILVGKLSPDPDWLGQIRTRVAMLSESCKQWQSDRPKIWSEVLTPFLDYYSLFKGFTDASARFGNNADVWIQALEQLKGGLEAGRLRTTNTMASFKDHIDNIKAVESLLNSSLNTAWGELASEEQQMVKLATEVTHLQDQLDQLQDNITSAEISSGKAYFQSALTISYTLLTTAGSEVPYLAIIGEVYTIGKMAYDLIVTDKEIADTINKIVELRVEATQVAQAAAETKAIIQLINNLDLSLAAMRDALPPLSSMWSTERDKTSAAISAIQAGAQPENMIELIAMPSAAATWKTLADFVPKITQATQPGKAVTITTTGTNSIGGSS